MLMHGVEKTTKNRIAKTTNRTEPQERRPMITAAVVILAILIAMTVLSAGGDGTDRDDVQNLGSISDLYDSMVNATEDTEIYLNGDITSDILLIGGDAMITIDHDHNLTIIGGDALVTRDGTLHFNITNNGAGTIHFENLILLNNGAASTGGMALRGGSYEFTNCEFIGLTRTAIQFNGNANDAAFMSCTFRDNSNRAVTLAPGTSSNPAVYSFTNCLFQNNTVIKSGGGAIRIAGSYFSIDVTDCAFIENKAIGTGAAHGSNNTVDGGALYISTDFSTGGILNVYDSYFENNFAQDDGGAIIVLGAKSYTSIRSNIVNSTFTGNTVAGAHYGRAFLGSYVWCTDGSGGAINYFGLTESEITHCTFYNNGITGALPEGVRGTSLGVIGGGGAIAVDTGEEITNSSQLPPMPKLTNNIFVGNYVNNPMDQSVIDFINGLLGGAFGNIKERSRTGNVFVLPMCDRDFQGVPQGIDIRMLQNNGNIGYDNGNWDTYGYQKSNSYTNNGVDLAAGIQVRNIFAYYDDNVNRDDPNTAIPTEYGNPVGAAGSTVHRKCFIPAPTSNELYRDGSVPYVAEVPLDTLGNVRDTFPNAGAVEIYWVMFHPGIDADWTNDVPAEVEDPNDPSVRFPAIGSLAFDTNNSYYVMTATGVPGMPAGDLIAMPRSAIDHLYPNYGFMGWRSSVPDLDWNGYYEWAQANGHTEMTVREFLENNPASDLPKEAFRLYQPGDVINSAKQTLTAEWRENMFRVDFDLNYDDEAVWYASSEPGKEAPRINIPAGSTIAAPSLPMRDKYIFMGWFKDISCTEAWDFDNDTVTEDTILYAMWGLSSAADDSEKGPSLLWPGLAIALTALIFLLIIFGDDDEEVIGIVKYNGKGLADVRIEYTEDNVKKKVTTDKDGNYSIDTDMGAKIVIMGLSKEGYSLYEVTKDGLILSGMPVWLHVDKECITVNFIMIDSR
ncbi:MAG: InlB B-repeat-containing protein [Methanomassiliicoccaceae archaeon]|jgi:hypothetical protein|nr:InlB B-repeat-containing protein [Methanomassiliicoccaceae archaeon]